MTEPSSTPTSTYSLLDTPDDLAFADCELPSDHDLAIHAGAWVRYGAPNNGFMFEGEAITYDRVTDRWLVSWLEWSGQRVDWVGSERLTLLLSAEVVALVARNGVA